MIGRNSQAFPTTSATFPEYKGLTKREFVAALIYSRMPDATFLDTMSAEGRKQATRAVLRADALFDELEKKP